MTPLTRPLREPLDFAETDALLRDDVRRLGAMVGTMLAEQVSDDFLQRVEAVRRTAIARREQGEPVDALADRLADVPLDGAEALVRAFAAYFGATNVAERVHPSVAAATTSGRAMRRSPAACKRCCTTCAMPASAWTSCRR